MSPPIQLSRSVCPKHSVRLVSSSVSESVSKQEKDKEKEGRERVRVKMMDVEGVRWKR